MSAGLEIRTGPVYYDEWRYGAARGVVLGLDQQPNPHRPRELCTVVDLALLAEDGTITQHVWISASRLSARGWATGIVRRRSGAHYDDDVVLSRPEVIQ